MEIKYAFNHSVPIELFPCEDLPIQINKEMKKYLGNEIIDDLTWILMLICESPYIILAGTEEDYKSKISKTKKLRKYEFEWYIDRIICCVEKMVEAKKGNIDIEIFKNIIQYQSYHSSCLDNTIIYACIIKFSFWKEEKYIRKKEILLNNFYEEENKEKYIKIEKSKEIDFMDIKEFDRFGNQKLIVPFNVKYTGIIRNIFEEYDIKYKIVLIGCDQNEKNEIYPIQRWIVSAEEEEKKEKIINVNL